MKKRGSFFLLFGANRSYKISIKTLLHRIWINRKFILKWEFVGIICGLILCFSFPKEYVTTVKIAPENVKIPSILTLINYTDGDFGSITTDIDAFSYRLYPRILQSNSFLTDLLYVHLPTEEDQNSIHFTVKDLLSSEYKKSWWQTIGSIFEKIFFFLKGNDSEEMDSSKLREQNFQLQERLKNNISLVVMDRTDYIELEVKMQDPLASAALADTIVARLEKYVQDYRKQKADLYKKYVTIEFEDAESRLKESSKIYAQYLDSHHNLSTNKERIEGDRLSFEKRLDYNDYRMLAQDLFYKKMSSKREKDVFFKFDPAIVATEASYPRKFVILSYFMFMFGFFSTMYSILKKA